MSDFPLISARLSRRVFIGAVGAGAAGTALSACTTADVALPSVAPADPAPADADLGDAAAMYGARTDAGYQLPAIPIGRLDPRFVRQVVDDPTGEKPGTIVVDTSQHFLYLVQGGGKALRYGVSLGKAGFGWTGSAMIQARKAWPTWTPPPEMIKRRPELAKYSAENGGMPPGPQNPLGARALYLFRDGRDTMYRLHGTPEWDSIGKNASSGCVRFINQDIIDLYARVTGAAQVHVRPNLSAAGRMAAVSDRMAEPIDAGVPADAEMLK